jgi:hypothetical protein
MKRRFLAAAVAAMLGLALVPGAAAAALPGTVDQSVAPGASTYSNDTVLTQTFTAGRTGALAHFELYCSGMGGLSANIDAAFEMAMTHPATCPATLGWTDFVLPTSYLVAAGHTYTLRIDAGFTPFTIGVAASDYAGGEAGLAGPPAETIPGVSDFAFRTYVQPLQTTSITWTPTTVPLGASTSTQLTVQVAFPAISLDPLAAPVGYQAQLTHLPSWFTPSSVNCTGPIDPSDCTLADFVAPGSGILWESGGGAATLTVNIPGTAAPGADDPPDIAEVYSCVLGTSGEEIPYFSFGMCDTADRALGVGNATPPPTATATGSSGSSGGAPLWLLPAALGALAGSLLALRRQARRIR